MPHIETPPRRPTPNTLRTVGEIVAEQTAMRKAFTADPSPQNREKLGDALSALHNKEINAVSLAATASPKSSAAKTIFGHFATTPQNYVLSYSGDHVDGFKTPGKSAG